MDLYGSDAAVNCAIAPKLLTIRVGILSTKKRTLKRRSGRPGGQRLRVDGAKLRKIRDDAELSIRALALDVGIDPSTVADLEAGRREWSQLRVIRSIAAHPAIDVDYHDLLVDERKTAMPRSVLPPRSSLDVYVDEERRLGVPERITTPHGELQHFGAIDLVRLFSSPSSVEGERYALRGPVHSTRGLSVTDGMVLGIRHQDGSRFEILRQIGALEKPMSLTVMTTNVEHTRRLQRAWTAQSNITLAIRVITTHEIPDDEDQVIVTSSDGGPAVRRRRRRGSELWRGFTQIEPKSSTPPRPHPWALIVDSIIGAE
jgi:transcriptional regulator with XRE-family HTH domain